MKALIFSLALIILLAGFQSNKQVDDQRMNKDLEIARNVLATLIKTETNMFVSAETIDASYIKDYGVVFTIPTYLSFMGNFGRGRIYINETPIPDIVIPPMPDFNFDFEFNDNSPDLYEEESVIVEIDMSKLEKDMEKANEAMQKAQEKAKLAQEKAQKRQEEIQKRVESRIYTRARGSEAGNNITETDWEKIMISFLADYADLIGQLQPNEKVKISQKKSFNDFVFSWDFGSGETSNSSGIVAEVKKQDITSYRTGKISRDEFEKRVNISKDEPSMKVADLEMFSSIFNRYFSKELSSTYVITSKASYELLPGFGVIYNVQLSSPNQPQVVVYHPRPGSVTAKAKSPDTANDLEEGALYLILKDDLKAFMLDYGRTIRSIADGEKVLVKVKFSGKPAAEVPKSIELAVPVSILRQYDQQKISKEKALNQLEIKEIF